MIAESKEHQKIFFVFRKKSNTIAGTSPCQGNYNADHDTDVWPKVH